MKVLEHMPEAVTFAEGSIDVVESVAPQGDEEHTEDKVGVLLALRAEDE